MAITLNGITITKRAITSIDDIKAVKTVNNGETFLASDTKTLYFKYSNSELVELCTSDELNTEVGPKGDTGPQGPKGDTGLKGDKGDSGVQGDKGDTGPKGDTGEDGPQGLPGKDGSAGLKGDKGPKGDTGDAGKDASLINTNGGGSLNLWVGTQTELALVSSKDSSTIYMVTEEV